MASKRPYLVDNNRPYQYVTAAVVIIWFATPFYYSAITKTQLELWPAILLALVYNLPLLVRRRIYRVYYEASESFSKGEYKQAIYKWKKFIGFVQRNPWVNNYRWLWMDHSNMDLIESSLYNIANSQLYLSDIEGARTTFGLMKKMYPDGVLADTQLDFLSRVELGIRTSNNSEN